MSSSERQSHNMAGESGFYHFYGVVEDRKDPLKAGRLRVRIFGKHSENVSDIPTGQLPWAQVMLPLNASPNEMVALADGQLVFGFYADGIEQQVPIIIGQLVVDGNEVKDTEGEKQTGFQDMRATKEVKRHNSTDFANAINVSRSSQQSTPQSELRQQNKKSVSGLFSFEEPSETNNGKYPWVKSKETESGHIIEIDDTPGEEKIYIWHRKGQYIELTKDGDVNIKATNDRKSTVDKDDWDIVLKDRNVYTGGNLKFQVNGNAEIKVNGNAKMNIGGSFTTDVSGTYSIKAGGNFTVNASQIRLN